MLFRSRQSISSTIGGIAIKKVYHSDTIQKLVQELPNSKAVGILSVAIKDINSPLEYIASPAKTILIPGTEYELNILEYIPHYSIDTDTKKVVNQSNKPVNPALKVAVNNRENSYEQWLWSKFPSFSHNQTNRSLNMKFTGFAIGDVKGSYTLVASSGAEPLLLASKKGEIKAEKVVLGRPYPFADEKYSFTIEKIIQDATIETNWKNNSEKLLHPAVIATISYSGTEREAVFEFGKPYHLETKLGTMVVLFKRQAQSSKISN